MTGDSISYWLGRLGYAGLGSSRWLSRHRRLRRKAEKFSEHYGLAAVFVGRFAWFIHPAVPTVAGIIRVRALPFYLLDVPAAILWVLLYMSLGYWLTGLLLAQTINLLETLSLSLLILLALVIAWRSLGQK